jgi:DNA-directed RNA polymerase subunit E'/Rpb7
MEIISIENRITLNPSCLDRNLRKNILKKLQKNLENECTKDYGFILKVNKINKILDNSISNASSEIIFNVLFEVCVLKPEINKVFEGEVCMIYPGGIFFSVLDKLKVLVHSTSIKEYKLDTKTNIFKNNEKSIKKGDILKIKIVGTKYTKKNFSTFGEIVN